MVHSKTNQSGSVWLILVNRIYKFEESDSRRTPIAALHKLLGDARYRPAHLVQAAVVSSADKLEQVVSVLA